MRRDAREMAFQVLFQNEFTPLLSLKELLALREEAADMNTLQYADLLIQGVLKNKKAIDESIQSSSDHWKISRMATSDRNILRIAVFEIKFSSDPIKPSIAINEAIEISKKFGNPESSSFVNGVLDQVAKTLSFKKDGA